MLNTIADEFSMSTVQVFQKCKIVFVHGTDKVQNSFFHYFLPCLLLYLITLEQSIYFWSLRFESKGPIFELWLEDTLHIKPDIDDKLDTLP
ncbi:uncharacterized protein B0P05DRAFT_542084 [Gilbertella persicaria]|uniref:uncharacterized protein n=1 Tax=Gilbertella persicaria TaxID=101096 RepID=UPI0022202A27|nr:uncharacterized protein B0P05DRAFT_542084 [Gilbertella persicaria]KAI8079023.1 hypothetical protein B0P05DRAFT_542084 [Gilbertella persicaria]